MSLGNTEKEKPNTHERTHESARKRGFASLAHQINLRVETRYSEEFRVRAALKRWEGERMDA